MTPQLPLSSDELDTLYDRMPDAFMGRKHKQSQSDVANLVIEHGPLTSEHIRAAVAHVESGQSLGTRVPDLQKIRHTHHRLAQLIAGGMNDTTAAALSNYSPARVAILRQSPAFIDLLAHYGAVREDAFAEFNAVAADLSLDMLGRLQEILDESPEKITPSVAIEAVKMLADRTGHAPVNKSVNLNVAADMGDRMLAIRERLRKVNT